MYVHVCVVCPAPSKDTGYADLETKRTARALPAADTKSVISEAGSKSHDPFPIPREDGKLVNPLSEDGGSAGDGVQVKESPSPLSEVEEPSSTMEPPGTSRQPFPGTSRQPFPSATNPQEHLNPSHFHSVLPGVVKVQSHSDSEESCIPDSTTMLDDQTRRLHSRPSAGSTSDSAPFPPPLTATLEQPRSPTWGISQCLSHRHTPSVLPWPARSCQQRLSSSLPPSLTCLPPPPPPPPPPPH